LAGELLPKDGEIALPQGIALGILGIADNMVYGEERDTIAGGEQMIRGNLR